MNRTRKSHVFMLISAMELACVGCAAPVDKNEEAVLSTQQSLSGGHLRGVSDADFNTATAAFVAVETVDDGLGPIFNEAACGNCHSLGGVGGAGLQIERRFGRFDNDTFNPLANEGGSLRQLMTLGTFTNSGETQCSVPLEVEPQDATVHNVGRLTTPLFGLGLVDAMPDSFFTNLARNQSSSIRGRVNMVSIVLPDPKDRGQSIGSRRVGRFGWKAGVPNLVQFAADAYVNEMGITTQHCFNGTSVTAFATESAPNGKPVAAGCDDNVPGTDEPVGQCSRGQTEIQDDVAQFTRFMTFLPPPPRASAGSTNTASADTASADATATAIATATSTTRDGRGGTSTQPPGQGVYDRAGCNSCHTRQTFTTPQSPANGVPGGFAFQPFSDFLLHDMGALGDQIGNAGDARATTRLMRTAPLWGVRLRTLLLHDGRATDVASAIQAHDGQGAAAARAFNALSLTDKQRLVQFVLSL